jgi:hypothetical protein
MVWRMKTTRPALFLFGLMCTALPLRGQAADSKGLYQTLYYIPCSTYAEDRKEPENSGKNAVDKIYVSGWLSGYNYLTPNTFDIAPDHNVDKALEWLDGFCAKKPQSSLEAGLLQLTDELYPNRMKEAPSAKPKAPETPFDDIHFHIQDK